MADNSVPSDSGATTGETNSTTTAAGARGGIGGGAVAQGADGSRTVTITRAEDDANQGQDVRVILRRKGEGEGESQDAKRPSVKWTDDTVDNEHLGRKSSKICCVYHKKRAFGESDSESEGESGDDCDHHCGH